MDDVNPFRMKRNIKISTGFIVVAASVIGVLMFGAGNPAQTKSGPDAALAELAPDEEEVAALRVLLEGRRRQPVEIPHRAPPSGEGQ